MLSVCLTGSTPTARRVCVRGALRSMHSLFVGFDFVFRCGTAVEMFIVVSERGRENRLMYRILIHSRDFVQNKQQSSNILTWQQLFILFSAGEKHNRLREWRYECGSLSEHTRKKYCHFPLLMSLSTRRSRRPVSSFPVPPSTRSRHVSLLFAHTSYSTYSRNVRAAILKPFTRETLFYCLWHFANFPRLSSVLFLRFFFFAQLHRACRR